MYKKLTGLFFSLLLATNTSIADNIYHKEQQLTTPKQVVVFDLGALDTLDQLGIAIKAVPKHNLPSYLAKYQADHYSDVGGLKTPNLEAIKAIKPDFIIISGRQKAQYKELATIASTLDLTIDTKQYEASFKKNMQLLGKTFQKESEVNKELANLDKQAAIIQHQANQSGKKALILVHYKGKFITSTSSNYAGLIHDWLGIKTVELNAIKKDDTKPRILLTDTEIATLNPDIIFIIDRNEAIGEGKMDREIVTNSAIEQTKAYQTHKVIYLTADLWYLSGNGLESVKLQMQEVAKAFR